MKPELDSEQAGIIWYSGDDDYIKLVVEFKQQSGRSFAILGREQNRSAKVMGMAPLPAGAVTLRLVLLGADVRALYRRDAGDWQVVGECAPVAAGQTQVGLFTHVSPGSTDRSAVFEAFRILEP
jgi:regulation of enolase protein 1 (concanavalin A-like superfamily)